MLVDRPSIELKARSTALLNGSPPLARYEQWCFRHSQVPPLLKTPHRFHDREPVELGFVWSLWRHRESRSTCHLLPPNVHVQILQLSSDARNPASLSPHTPTAHRSPRFAPAISRETFAAAVLRRTRPTRPARSAEHCSYARFRDKPQSLSSKHYPIYRHDFVLRPEGRAA